VTVALPGLTDMELSIEERDPGALIATVRGEVDMAVAGTLQDQLCQAVWPGRRLVVDLTAVSLIDASGLDALVATRGMLQEHNGIIRLVVAAPLQLRELEITGLDAVFPIHATLDDALAADRADIESA
jgi:anti-sigma B factor antagonist